MAPRRRFQSVVLGMLAMATARGAPAQATPAADSTVVLPPVSVTATRARSPLLATPLAVTRVDAAALRAVRGIGLDEALQLVPGVLAQSRYGSSDVRLVIRGFGARGAGDRSNSGTSRGVRVLVDGIPETEPDGRTSFDQIDLGASESVEIVRSNASALWGNAAGGVINVVTVPAVSAGRFETQAMAGTFGLRRIVARTATRIGGKGIAYATFTNSGFDGWRAHSSARRALLNAGAVGMAGSRARIGVYASGANNLFHVPGPMTAAQVATDPRQANPVYAARDERRHNRVARLASTLEYAVGDASSLSAMIFVSPKFLQRSERNTFRDFHRYHVGGHVVARTRMAVHGGALTLFAGVDEAYQDGSIRFHSLAPDGTRGATLRDDKREGANNAGAFSQGELCLGRSCLTLGARYDQIRYDYESFVGARLHDTKSFGRLTPMIGLSVRLDSSRSVYANLGGGIEAPAGNETDPAGTFGDDSVHAINPLLDAIHSTTWEVGYKSVARTDSPVGIGFDIALYTTAVRNEIVPYQAGRFYFTAGSVRRSGAELGLALQRGSTFARSAVTFSRNRYTTYVVDSVHYGRPGARASYAGNRVVGVPDVMANGEVGAAVPGAPALGMKLGVEHSGGYFADDANLVRVPEHTILNAGVQLRERGLARGWRVSGFASLQNVLDRRYIGSAFLNPDRLRGEPVAFEPGSGRSLVISLSVRQGMRETATRGRDVGGADWK